jgi:serine/threonine protein kinase
VPQTVDGGKIVLGECIGRGAQGVVHAALRGDEPLAVKLVLDEDAGLRFRGESRALASMAHPHVVRLAGWGSDAGWSWIAMERLDQSVLERVEARGPLEVPDALTVIFDALTGLAALHHRGILHRDLKPANVFLRSDGSAVLGDLGIARLPDGAVNYETATGTNLGTVDFTAPEQVADAKRVDVRADVFGAGATLYAIATGRRPSFLYAPREFPQVYEALPASLRPLVERACAHDPEERFADARDMAVAIAEQLEAAGRGGATEHMERFDERSPAPGTLRRVWNRALDLFTP